MSSKYETEPELRNRNNSHTLIVEFVGDDKRVLDVGAATGYIAKILSGRRCEVVGIEIDPDAARQAEEHCERVIVGDVESLDLDKELNGDSFDVILFGDLLEHLKDPLQVIKRFAPFLRRDGYVVTSIPNIAHGSVRLSLLQGRFEYGKLGLLDDTHLRFFTRHSVERLFEDAGFEIGEMQRTRLGIFDTEVKVDRELVSSETLERLQSDPESRTYQFVLTAYPSGNAAAAAKAREQERLRSEQIAKDTPPHDPGKQRLDNLQKQLDARNGQLAERNQTIKELRKQLGDHENLRRQLNARDIQLSTKDQTVHELQRQVRNQEEIKRRLAKRDSLLEERQREVSRLAQEVTNRNGRLARSEKIIQRLEHQVSQLQKGAE